MPAKSGSQNPAPVVDAGSQSKCSLRSYVVGIRPRDGNKACVGTAFLLGTDQDGNTYAVTCLHVVRNHDQVDLWFKPDEQPGIEITADVLTQAQDMAHDIGVLRLSDSLPTGLKTLALEPWNNRQIAFESYGFAQDTNGHFISDGQIDHNVPVPDALGSHVTNGELLQLSYKNLVPGLSGAPVVLKGTHTAVGMIIAGHIPSDTHPMKDTGYAQTGDVILTLCKHLGIAPAQSYQVLNDGTETELIRGRSAWLDRMLLHPDPFPVPDGAREKHVVKYFWTMPEFSEVLGDQNLPSTMLVFGDQGSGRSSLCRALEESYQRWGLLTVRYDGGTLVGSDKEITAADHVPELIEAALLAVATDLEQHSDRKERVGSGREVLRQVYCHYVDRYVRDPSKQEYLRDMLNMSGKDAEKSPTLSNRELLRRFCNHTLELVGYQGIVFLVDPRASSVINIKN